MRAWIGQGLVAWWDEYKRAKLREDFNWPGGDFEDFIEWMRKHPTGKLSPDIRARLVPPGVKRSWRNLWLG